MTQQLLVFKNNLPNITALKIYTQDFASLKEKLQYKLNQAPMMFVGMNLVVDLSALESDDELYLDTAELFSFLHSVGINPIACMTDRASYRKQLIEQGFGVLPVLVSNSMNDKPKVSQVSAAEPAIEKPQPVAVSTEEPRKTFEAEAASHKTGTSDSENLNQIIRHPVRSGQRVYCRGDLTVVGAVSPGAEVIADGNIHIYGKLSGRAVAGAQGDESAVIFCNSLDAELVSIAGNYKQLEAIDDDCRHKRVQISLENEKIAFLSL